MRKVEHKVLVKTDTHGNAHANCSCGWHGQSESEKIATSYGDAHIRRNGGVGAVTNASKINAVRPKSESVEPTGPKESEPVGGVRGVDGTQTAPKATSTLVAPKPALTMPPKPTLAPAGPQTAVNKVNATPKTI